MTRPMNAQEFLQYVKDNKEHFRFYCEVLINPKGDIILGIPSHTEALVREVMQIENCTRDDVRASIPIRCAPMEFLCDKYTYCAVWYQSVLTPIRMTKEQAETIHILQDEEIIHSHFSLTLTEEYMKHCWRITMFGVD